MYLTLPRPAIVVAKIHYSTINFNCIVSAVDQSSTGRSAMMIIYTCNNSILEDKAQDHGSRIENT